jgi:hypothetical protein
MLLIWICRNEVQQTATQTEYADELNAVETGKYMRLPIIADAVHEPSVQTECCRIP